MTAPTYLVNGDAGNREGHHEINTTYNPSWSAFRTTSYSFSKFSIYNATHIHLQQITADSELPAKDQGKVLDDTWFIQNRHGPYQRRSEMISSNDQKEPITYDPYKEYGIEMKVAPPDEDIRVPFISGNKQDYKGIKGVHF